MSSRHGASPALMQLIRVVSSAGGLFMIMPFTETLPRQFVRRLLDRIYENLFGKNQTHYLHCIHSCHNSLFCLFSSETYSKITFRFRDVFL